MLSCATLIERFVHSLYAPLNRKSDACDSFCSGFGNKSSTATVEEDDADDDDEEDDIFVREIIYAS